LARLQQIQAEVSYPLIRAEEIEIIKQIWAKDFSAPMKAAANA